MCGRYVLHANPDVVALQFALDSPPEFKASYNIAPASDVLIVKDKKASYARWGLRGRFVNLRAETVLSRFRTSGRCLVPASGFYEWQTRGGRKQPYYFFPKGEPLLGFAALWERDTCALITTDAIGALRNIHDRMPVIVARQNYAAWLAGSEDLPPHAALEWHPVSMAVNAVANDSPKLIEPVELARGLFD
jgi:putative SOS response-associated peptidase YedK